MVPAAPTPGFPPKIASSLSAQSVFDTPPLIVQFADVDVSHVPEPLSTTPFASPAASTSHALMAAKACDESVSVVAAAAVRRAVAAGRRCLRGEKRLR